MRQPVIVTYVVSEVVIASIIIVSNIIIIIIIIIGRTHHGGLADRLDPAVLVLHICPLQTIHLPGGRGDTQVKFSSGSILWCFAADKAQL
jgi:hypothetical protein